MLTGIGGLISAGVFGELGTEYPMPVYIVILRILTLILCFAAVTAGFLFAVRFLRTDKAEKLDDRMFNTRFIILGVGVILVLQLVCAFCLQMKPITDIQSIDSYAAKIISDQSFACLDSDFNGHYIIRYQNNLPILLLITLIYRASSFFTGEISHIPVIVLNTLAVNAAVLMTVLTSRKLFGGRKAVLTLLICALFTPYYTYTPYFYTDSFSLPFVAGTVYTFVAACQTDKRRKKLLFLLLSGTLCFVGFELKASVIILLIAILIYLPLRMGIKRAAKNAAVILASFVILFVTCTAAIKASGMISDESSERYQFPAAHWVMMGLKDFGAYNDEDGDFSKSFHSKTERQQAAVEEIVKRVNEKGFFGMAVHLGKKAVWTYMDGTYYIANYLEHYERKTPLHEFVLYEGKYRFGFYAYSFGYQLFLLLMIACSGLHACRTKKLTATTLFRVALFGMLLFFLIWETNARYPFNFTPLYMLLATEGADALEHRLRSRGIKPPRQKTAP